MLSRTPPPASPVTSHLRIDNRTTRRRQHRREHGCRNQGKPWSARLPPPVESGRRRARSVRAQSRSARAATNGVSHGCGWGKAQGHGASGPLGGRLLEAPCWGGSSRPNTAFWRAQFQECLGGLRATGKAAYTGIDIDLEWAAIWTIRDGKLTRAQGYLSRADAAEAAGLSE
jgi:hypothetical protein